MATNNVNPYQVSNVDYTSYIAEATKGKVAGTPNIFRKIQSFSLKPSMNKGEDTRLAGHKGARSDLMRGQRSYEGTVNAYAEPNFMYHDLKMLFKAGTTGASGTQFLTTFDPLSIEEPTSYTVDRAMNGKVTRYAGVESAGMPFSPEEGDNVFHNESDLRALNHFSSAKIVSATGSGPTTLVLDTDYDASPTSLLFVGDTLQFLDKSEGTYLPFTIASIVDSTSITVTADASALAAGDIMYIKPALASGITWFSEQSPFEWGGMTVQKGNTLAGIASFCSEPDTTCKFLHTIVDGTCAGLLHTTSLRRTVSDAEVTIKRLVATDTDYSDFIDNEMQVYQFQITRGTNVLTMVFYGKVEEVEVTAESTELEMQTITVKPIIDPLTSGMFTISLTNNYDTT